MLDTALHRTYRGDVSSLSGRACGTAHGGHTAGTDLRTGNHQAVRAAGPHPGTDFLAPLFRQAKEAADKEQAGEGKEDPQPFFPRAKAAEEAEDDVVDEDAKPEAEGKEVEVQEELPADAAPAGAPWLIFTKEHPNT